MKYIKVLILKILALGKLFIFIIRKHNTIRKTELFFFFPFYHTGGAEKVHADIVSEFEQEKTFIFFEGKSNSEANKHRFIEHSDYFEIFDFLNRSKYIKKIFLIYLKKIINKNKKAVVFSCSSGSFYELIPFLKNHIKKVDLLHMFTYPHKGGEISSLPYVKYIDKRIVINKRTLFDYTNLYKKNNLSGYLDRIEVIHNGIELNNIEFQKKDFSTVKVAFVGRWCIEKRPELYLEIASLLQKKSKKFKFYYAGTNNKDNIEEIKKNNIISLGDVKDPKILKELYKELHFLLVPSKLEGFPVVIMECMNYGVVPICSDIGGISEHITNGINGVIIKDHSSAQKVVSDFVDTVLSIDLEESYHKLSMNAYNYAQSNYDVQKCKASYRKLLVG
jgi:glycosyltransferase involved in cell wall biosynthesis